MLLCVDGCGGEGVDEVADFEQDFVGARGCQGKFEHALRRELRAALGVARDEAHEVLRDRWRRSR